MFKNILHNSYYACVINFLFIILCSCKVPELIDIGRERFLYDSSQIQIGHQDRLAYVELLNYQTNDHTAGEMMKKESSSSGGFLSKRQSKLVYTWSGKFHLRSANAGQINVQYESTLEDVLVSEPAFKLFANNSSQNNEMSLLLTISGTIASELHTSPFHYSVSELGVSSFMEGYLVYKEDTMWYRPIYKLAKNNSGKKNPYGYALYMEESMTAATNYGGKTKFVYLKKELDQPLHEMVIGFLSIIAGNQKIVPRRSTALKRFY